MYMHPLEEMLACFTSGGDDDVVRARRFAGFEKEGNDAALSRTSSPLVQVDLSYKLTSRL
jgi:hypothetical protein